MAVPDNREKDLSFLQIDRSQKDSLPPEKKRSFGPVVYIAAAVIVVLVVIAAVSWTFANASEVTVQRPRIEQGGATGPVTLTAGGYIVAHHTIEVSSKVVGKVKWVGVEKGDMVKEGQVLVRLDDSEYLAQLNQAKANLGSLQAKLAALEAGSRPQEILAAQAGVEQAQADTKNAELTLTRTRDLFNQKIDSQAQLDNAQAQFDMAKARLANARQNYNLVKIGPRIEDINYARAQVEQARASVAYAQTLEDATLIEAPVSGTVLERNIELGELVSNMSLGGTGGVKTSVVTLADLNDQQVELDINQNDFPKISAHQNCAVTADAYPDRVYKGVVAEISPEANRQKATIQVKVKILKPDEYLRPEMNAHVSFLAPETSKSSAPAGETLSIPRSAVVQKDGKPSVFVLDGSHVRQQEVELGRDLGDRVEVSTGIGPNDQVVISVPDGLSSGQRVKVKSQS
ncbi:MAG TPA: efflux RND transporter periplasmic adaptor subunit [Terriglobia bacterium]|nr:efflux RND transporter periplasmic adaptor subunit [Terriglobia bacterium]